MFLRIILFFLQNIVKYKIRRVKRDEFFKYSNKYLGDECDFYKSFFCCSVHLSVSRYNINLASCASKIDAMLHNVFVFLYYNELIPVFFS